MKNDFQLLRKIERKLGAYFQQTESKSAINASDFYAIIQKTKLFQNQIVFNQLLRRTHSNGMLKQVIPNYAVNTAYYQSWQWKFFAKVGINVDDLGLKADIVLGRFSFHKQERKVIASNGEKLRSNQELKIYEALITLKAITVFYEKPLTLHGETRYPDFTVINKRNRRTFYWEHIGMTHDPEYLDRVKESIEWYRNNGLLNPKSAEQAIFTYYTNNKEFCKLINDSLAIIQS